ncbi:MAG TPA: alpha/beta hydrolase [Chloroflexota bacterium]|nr:alpha/beta hydrolase [Chloroflexota bacterium]
MADSDLTERESEVTPPGFNDPPFVLPDTVELRTGIVYSRPSGRELTLDLFLPKHQTGRKPGMIFVHGGGWRGGTPRQFWRQATHLAALGWPGVSISYRFTPEFHFPSQLEDAQAGVRWLRAHADELGVDPNRIGAAGGSAGGHLVALLGTTNVVVDRIHSRVQAVVSFNGVFDFPTLMTEDAREPRRALLGDDPEAPIRASPLYHVDENAAPTLLLHGTADVTIPIAQSLAFQQKLQACGVRAELFVAEGAAHGFFNRPPFYQPTLERMEHFLREILGD